MAPRDEPLRKKLLDPITSCEKYQEQAPDVPASTNPCSQGSEQVLGAQVLLFQRRHLYGST